MTQTPNIDRPLPNSADSERVLLGSQFVDENLFAQIEGLPTEYFHHPVHRTAFTAMRNLAGRKERVDPITVYNEIQAIKPALQISVSELANWSYGLPNVTSLERYILILKDKNLKRNLIKTCSKIITDTVEESDLGASIASDALLKIQDIYATSLDKQKPTVTLSEGLEANYERWRKMLEKQTVTVETGLPNVDEFLTGGGIEKGMFHVLGARPGIGKTSAGLDIAAHNVLQGKTVVFFTLELSREVLLDRFIAPLAGVPRWQISSKWMDEHTCRKLTAVGEFIKKHSLFINHKARSAQDMRLALKETARQTGGEIDLIIVDFLTKMTGGKHSKYESVSYNANALAEFAPEYNAACLSLAQFSRDIVKRRNETETDAGKPRESDFRDSGEIEELARTIFALWGEDKSSGMRDVNFSCLKQGEGQIFDTTLVFDTNMMTFGGRQSLIQKENN